MFLASALGSVVPLWQTQKYFEDSIHMSNELHRQGIQIANDLHREEQALEFALHRRSLALERELHAGEMSHEIEIARREAVRDVWQQKSQLTQTLMIVDTLMFSCAAAVFCEGDVPADTAVALVRFYAFVLGVAMSALCVSVWLSMLLQARMSRYDMHHPRQLYSCGRTHLHFNEYFACHCRLLEAASFITFVLGTSCCVIAGGIYTSTALALSLSYVPAAWTFGGFTLIAFVIAVGGLLPTAAGAAADADTDHGGLAAVETEREQMRRKASTTNNASSAQLRLQKETAEFAS